jgi:Xaa-Pro aminopeptidase
MIDLNALDDSLWQSLHQRRQNLAQHFPDPVILWSGRSLARNYPHNTYPYRASSHFLYFAGLPIENAAILLVNGNLTLFWDEDPPEAALWHGKTPSRAEIAARIQAHADYPPEDLLSHPCLDQAATIPVQDPYTRHQQAQILGRELLDPRQSQGRDYRLIEVISTLRRIHDSGALGELRKAASVTVQAHQAGMRSGGISEGHVRAQMEAVIMAAGMTCAYPSIVTTHGQVLHNQSYQHSLSPGDLVLADVGSETALGWASDVTRTWPVSGSFSASQRDIYDIVLAAHDACIARAAPGVEYLDLHLLASRILAEGLVSLKILNGDPEDLVSQDAHALFFPHGIGHLLGLDVHDMEDLGDIAGYASGRQRSSRFGLGYLRLHRPLEAGMVVTIEPGFYQVPAILGDPIRRETYRQVVNWDRLAQFEDVRGIRIEDDIWITSTGSQVLTQELPTDPQVIEEWVDSGCQKGAK